MRPKLVLAGVPLAALVLCLLATFTHVAHACIASPALCATAAAMCDLAVMLGPAGLPLLVWTALAGAAAIRTLRQTQQVVRVWLAQPRLEPAPALQALFTALGVAGRVDLIATEVPLALCYGLWRPRILLSAGLLARLAPDELRAVVLHERAHVQRRDPLRLLGWCMLDAACWWLPPGLARARLRYELLADRAVIRAGARVALARALLNLLERPVSAAVAPVALGGLSMTAARIDHLLAPEAPLPAGGAWQRVGLPLALAVVALACSLLMLRG